MTVSCTPYIGVQVGIPVTSRGCTQGVPNRSGYGEDTADTVSAMRTALRAREALQTAPRRGHV